MAAVREIEPDKKYELKIQVPLLQRRQGVSTPKTRRTGTRARSAERGIYVILSMRSVAENMAKHTTRPLYVLLNEHGVDQFMREFEAMPFVFVRMEKAGDGPMKQQFLVLWR